MTSHIQILRPPWVTFIKFLICFNCNVCKNEIVFSFLTIHMHITICEITQSNITQKPPCKWVFRNCWASWFELLKYSWQGNKCLYTEHYFYWRNHLFYSSPNNEEYNWLFWAINFLTRLQNFVIFQWL